jgi:hypothetical protein
MSLAEEFDPPPDEFWDARGALRHIRDFAHSRRVGPWALLGAIVVRTIAAVPPNIVLPALVGSQASINRSAGEADETIEIRATGPTQGGGILRSTRWTPEHDH